MPPTMTPQEFVEKWRPIALKESAAAKERFIDLCRLLGHETPAAGDPQGTHYTFEAGASKTTGGQGYADVWKRGYFAWEYKGPHADLDRAYAQLLNYREALENPPLLIVSDMAQIRIHTNFTNTVKRVETLALDDLLIPERLDILRAAFTAPDRLKAAQSPRDATEDAAREFARLAEILRRYGEEPQAVAHYLIRLLFCLFAEDIGLLPDAAFSALVRATRRRPKVFQAQVQALFSAMAEGAWFGPLQIPHIDGGLFDGATALELDTGGMEILDAACGMDWSSIDPSILGTLFERSLDPAKRSQLGAHYTSLEDINRIVEPVLMAPLRRRWAEVQERARALAGAGRNGRQKAVAALLTGFAGELAEVQVLDPACGSGNFLYVALRSLLDLWKEVAGFGFSLGLSGMMPLYGLSPCPAQLHGLEVNPYAHALAQTTVWIGYLQWLRENGYGYGSEPILRPLETVRRMDAVLAYDEEGRPVEPEWPRADVIIGNPPFLGDRRMRGELGDEYVDALRALYRDRLPSSSDLVCYWFERARTEIERGRARRAGLLATQAIRGGSNRVVLQRIKESGDIFWAHSDREWVLDGANVHVSMVAFDDGSEAERSLDGTVAVAVNPDLTSGTDLSVARRLAENASIGFVGTQKSGPFDLTAAQAHAMHNDKGNPHGRSNCEVVKPWINAIDVTRRPRGMWIVDFADMPLETACMYEAPFEHVREHVGPVRSGVRRKSHRDRWWQFGDTRPGLRRALHGLHRFIVTPMVAKHRVFVWTPSGVVPENLLVVFAREDSYFLGVLHARPHELWALRQGTQLEDRPRYTPTTTFETYPFPWPPGQEPTGDPRVEAIAEAARSLVALRDAWLNPPGASPADLKARTLTNLYNRRPTWLANAHRALDEAVFAAYGWPPNIEDEEVLARLLALNLERAEAG